MTFDDILDQAIELLRRRGRVTYRTLKRQFSLDDEALEDLKEELINGLRLAVDEDERVLVWTGDPAAPEPDAQREAEAEVRFHAILPVLSGLLEREERVTYRRLKYIFGLNDALLEEIRKELTFQQVALNEKGEGLVWTGV